MPPRTPPGQQIADRMIRHATRRHRMARGTERKIEELLREVMRGQKRELERLLGDLAARGVDPVRASKATKRAIADLEGALADLRKVLREGYREAGTVLRQDLLTAGRVELSVQNRLLELASDSAGAGRISRIAPREILTAIVDQKPFKGALLKDWARKMEADGFSRVERAIREGLAIGRSPSETTDLIVGKWDRRLRQYRGGLIDGAVKREIQGVVQTAYSHVQSEAQLATYRENADLIEYLIWDSELDEGTTPECRIRSGKKYTLDGRPIGHRIPWLEGPGKLHWGCRSLALPSIIGLDDPEIESFPDWIVRQSRATQEEILGVQRTEWLRSGEVAPDRYYNTRGRWLRIEEVAKREGVEAA